MKAPIITISLRKAKWKNTTQLYCLLLSVGFACADSAVPSGNLPLIDIGVDAGNGGFDAGVVSDSGTDPDAGFGADSDAAPDAGADANTEVGVDSGTGDDGGVDADVALDGSSDASPDAVEDTGSDAGFDGEADAGEVGTDERG